MHQTFKKLYASWLKSKPKYVQMKDRNDNLNRQSVNVQKDNELLSSNVVQIILNRTSLNTSIEAAFTHVFFIELTATGIFHRSSALIKNLISYTSNHISA